MSNFSGGQSALAPDVVVVASGGAQIAGPILSAGAGPFAGAASNWSSGAVSGRLQSITITAWGSTPGLPGAAPNQLMVIPPLGDKIILANGESRTWSVARNDDVELLREFEVEALGSAYATITWTVVQ